MISHPAGDYPDLATFHSFKTIDWGKSHSSVLHVEGPRLKSWDIPGMCQASASLPSFCSTRGQGRVVPWLVTHDQPVWEPPALEEGQETKNIWTESTYLLPCRKLRSTSLVKNRHISYGKQADPNHNRKQLQPAPKKGFDVSQNVQNYKNHKSHTDRNNEGQMFMWHHLFKSKRKHYPDQSGLHT